MDGRPRFDHGHGRAQQVRLACTGRTPEHDPSLAGSTRAQCLQRRQRFGISGGQEIVERRRLGRG